MWFLYFIVSIVFSSLLFKVLFNGLNMSMLHLFVPIQKFTSKLKRKRLYYGIIAIIFIVTSVFIKDFFHLNNISSGILLGAFISLNDMVFEKGVN